MSSGPDTSSAGSTGPGRLSRIAVWAVMVLASLAVAAIYLAADPTPTVLTVIAPFLGLAAVCGVRAVWLLVRRHRLRPRP